ncbi:MAG: phosphonate ABC transporter, permease protein PhnE [Rubrimonas sp.]|uniref:phosphonate ABC transporter, permease protein PhnE n=1 Tax=Rubrimonas sp. TaxID=2036015 RepID=UPI002FDE2311
MADAALPMSVARHADAVQAAVRRRMWLAIAAPLLVLAYLAYTWVAFDVSGLIARAQPERAGLLALDSIAHKVHVEENLRRGDLRVSIEGERTATYAEGAFPDWVRREGDRLDVDLGDGYRVEIEGPTARFAIPDYGVIDIRVTADGVEADYPGPVPDWVSGNEIKFDARPTTDRRLQVSRSKIEVHRYFWGWENFWFAFDHPLHGRSAGEMWSFVTAEPRLDPARSNLRYAWDGWLANPDWQHGEILVALFETFLMAVLGTITAAFVALPLAFLAASNFTPFGALRFFVRRVFDFLRGVDSLIWSLIFIRAFGLGPLTGSLAIAFTDTGSLGKLFSEALENVDGRQIEGVDSTGANRAQIYRFGVIPQILPVFLSQSLYYLESNVRSATVIGALGAGGIGLMLVETMRTARDWENTLYIILLIVVLVIVMDSLSGWLRDRLIRGGAA